MPDAHANFAYSLVATAPSPATSGTSLVVTAGQGALFPAVPFNAVIWPTAAQPLSTTAEVVRVTAISTDTLTITRAQEGTAARTVVVGDQISAAITNLTLTDAERSMKVVSSSGAYAITAADCGKIISQTGNSAANIAVTVASTAATLGSGFHFYVEHAGTGTSGANKKLVFTPTTSTVDGAATITDYPGSLRLYTSDGTNWVTKLLRGGFIDIAVADSVYTFTVPTGWTSMDVGAWGAGGAGGGGEGRAAPTFRSGGGAGGGAKCNSRRFVPGDLGTSVTCTVGAGAGTAAGGSTAKGSNGSAGNNTTFGALITAYGGGGGSGGNLATGSGGGGGGGGTAVGTSTTDNSGASGGAAFLAGAAANTNSATDSGGGGGTAPANGGSSFRGGGGGSAGGFSTSGSGAGAAGASSAYSAAGGGGGGAVTAASPGTALAGGAGGNTGCGTVTTFGGGGTAGAINGGTAAGTATQTDKELGGQGGGGGGGHNAGTGGAGATGTVPGGGGGGGGGGTSVGGAGGDGGAGAIRIWYLP